MEIYCCEPSLALALSFPRTTLQVGKDFGNSSAGRAVLQAAFTQVRAAMVWCGGGGWCFVSSGKPGLLLLLLLLPRRGPLQQPPTPHTLTRLPLPAVAAAADLQPLPGAVQAAGQRGAVGGAAVGQPAPDHVPFEAVQPLS